MMAKYGYFAQNWTDAEGNHAGGIATGRGFTISWQRGPLGHGTERTEPNGAFLEDILDACIEQLRYFQEGKYPCADNEAALEALEFGAECLAKRTKDRETRGIEGTLAT